MNINHYGIRRGKMNTFQDLQQAINTNTKESFIFGAIADYK